jgi:hypothetical protein
VITCACAAAIGAAGVERGAGAPGESVELTVASLCSQAHARPARAAPRRCLRNGRAVCIAERIGRRRAGTAQARRGPQRRRCYSRYCGARACREGPTGGGNLARLRGPAWMRYQTTAMRARRAALDEMKWQQQHGWVLFLGLGPPKPR